MEKYNLKSQIEDSFGLLDPDEWSKYLSVNIFDGLQQKQLYKDVQNIVLLQPQQAK